MKLVAALVVGLVVLEVERKSQRAVELELAGLVRPCECPPRVDPRAVEADDRKETCGIK